MANRDYFDENYIGCSLGSFKIVGIRKSEFGNAAVWDCECSKCGGVIQVIASEAVNGRRLRCKCGNTFSRVENKENWSFSRLDEVRLRRIYRRMIERCYNEKDRDYKSYGGAGISVCTEWLVSFSNFLNWALDSGYRPWLDLKRHNNKLDFTPENCCWGIAGKRGGKEHSDSNVEVGDICEKYGLNIEKVVRDIKNRRITVDDIEEVLSGGRINRTIKADVRKLVKVRDELLKLGNRFRVYSYLGKGWKGLENIERDIDTCVVRLSNAIGNLLRKEEDSNE